MKQSTTLTASLGHSSPLAILQRLKTWGLSLHQAADRLALRLTVGVPPQEMEDAALQVMGAARKAEALLGERAAALAAVTAEHERKQAEARTP